MKKSKKYKSVIIVLALILLPIGAFTIGYFFSNDEVKGKELGNSLVVEGEIGGSVKDEITTGTNGIVPGDTIDRSISIKPNCTTPSLLRVKIEPYWDGTSNGNKKDDSYIKLNYNEGYTSVKIIDNSNGVDWYEAEDGYLYYMGQVDKNIKLMNMVDNITFDVEANDDTKINDYQGKILKVNVNLDIVQCKYNAFESAWQITDDNLKEKLASISTQ